MSDSTFMGVPRDKIDWSPRIDLEKCDNCMECIAFCPHQVFAVDETAEKKVSVGNPDNCVVFCRACGKTCGPDAIAFPSKTETTAHIKAIRKEAAVNE